MCKREISAHEFVPLKTDHNECVLLSAESTNNVDEVDIILSGLILVTHLYFVIKL